MQTQTTYAPKINSEAVQGLCFAESGTAVEQIFKDYPVGKILFVSDYGSFGIFASAVHSPRALAVVLDGEDALPLFSMPDGAVCVAAAGRRETLLAARGFAAVCGLPAVLFPSDATLYGALDKSTYLLTGGVRGRVNLNADRVVCDEERLKPTLGGALAGLYLSRLALFEGRALSLLLRRDQSVASEEAFVLLEQIKGRAEDIVAANASLRALEEDGLPVGEGYALAKLLKERGEKLPQWRAFLMLSSLYAAFFRKGKPRKYCVPDYGARFKVADLGDTGYVTAKIPTTEEYSRRALALERARGELAREIGALAARRTAYLTRIRGYTGAEEFAGDLTALSRLPEAEPNGLCAIIRDFGLMEEL